MITNTWASSFLPSSSPPPPHGSYEKDILHSHMFSRPKALQCHIFNIIYTASEKEALWIPRVLFYTWRNLVLRLSWKCYTRKKEVIGHFIAQTLCNEIAFMKNMFCCFGLVLFVLCTHSFIYLVWKYFSWLF